MTRIEMRLAASTRAQLDRRTRERLQSLAHLLQKYKGAELLSCLITYIHRNWHHKPAAAALALDELLLLQESLPTNSRLLRTIDEFSTRLRRLRFKRRTPREILVLGVLAQVRLKGMDLEVAKRELGEFLSAEARKEYSPYTLARVSRAFDDARRLSIAIEAEENLVSLEASERLRTLAILHANHLSPFSWRLRARRLWENSRLIMDKNVYRSLSTAELTLLATIQRSSSASLAEVMMMEELLSREDRHSYRWVEAIAYAACAIANSKSLRQVIRAELVQFPLDLDHAPLLLWEFSQHGILPMQYLVRHICSLQEQRCRLEPLARLRTFVALVHLGVFSQAMAREVYEVIAPLFHPTQPWLIDFLVDAVWAFAVCDVQWKSTFAADLLRCGKELIRAHYEELDERALVRLYRASLSARIRLPQAVRDRARQVVRNIKRNPPRASKSEMDFVSLLKQALPNAEVLAGGFQATHHTDALVTIGEHHFDAELDGRVHDVFDLHGTKVGRRGADVLRDRLIEDEGYRVVRFSHDDLKRPDVVDYIRLRFKSSH